MISFLYTARWALAGAKRSYLLEAKTYTMAEKYAINSLKCAIFPVLRVQVLRDESLDDFVMSVKWIYENTDQEDRVRDVFIIMVLEGMEDAWEDKNGPISRLMLDVPEFSLDILRAIRVSQAIVPNPQLFNANPQSRVQRVHYLQVHGLQWYMEAQRRRV